MCVCVERLGVCVWRSLIPWWVSGEGQTSQTVREMRVQICAGIPSREEIIRAPG